LKIEGTRSRQKGVIAMHARVRDVMTTNVVAVRKSVSYKEIADRLREFRVSGLPVLDDDGKVAGVVSAVDLLAKEARPELADERHGRLFTLLHRRELGKARAVTAGKLMTAPPVTVGPDEPVSYAAQLMYVHRVKRLPVVGADGRLAGIISRSDVLAVFSRPDEEIRQEIIRDVILDGFFMDPASFTVTVKDGIVTLEGGPETAVVGQGIIEQIRHLQGVVAVRPRLAQPQAQV
jgi:CBS-domain-containing membrane protein